MEFCSTGLILQAKSHKVLVSLDAIHTVMLKEYGEWEGEEVTETLKTLETELGEVRTSIQKMAAGLRDLNNVPEVTWEDVGERDSRCLALPDMLAVA